MDNNDESENRIEMESSEEASQGCIRPLPVISTQPLNFQKLMDGLENSGNFDEIDNLPSVDDMIAENLTLDNESFLQDMKESFIQKMAAKEIKLDLMFFDEEVQSCYHNLLASRMSIEPQLEELRASHQQDQPE